MKNYSKTIKIKPLAEAELKSIEGGGEIWTWLGETVAHIENTIEAIGDYLISLETPTDFPIKRPLI
ncbi:MAG: hypothetical protein KAH68_07725 [Draconibacterium sp.]|nr:hypothetical protein [Bacteroidales bacterium]MCK5730947.1 hypothetical protein [Draconibacterium sp.]